MIDESSNEEKRSKHKAPLPALRILLRSCSITLVPMTHQVNALPDDKDLEFYFVPAKHMELFRPYHKPGEPYGNLKLINFGQPAISLTFFVKHKYRINRNVNVQTAIQILNEHRDTLYNQSFFDQLSASQQQELQRTDALLRQIRQQPDRFAFCVSNYHHFYRYWYCSFRFFEDDQQLKTSTANEHMLKHTQRSDKGISERINIIFVDTDYITRPVPYDNKQVDRELDTYSDRYDYGKAALYVKSFE